MEYYLGRWEWDTTEETPFWRPPKRAISALDLRSLPECGTQGGTGGLGFFALPTLDTNQDVHLGNALSERVKNPVKRAAETVLGLKSGEITAETVIDLLAQFLTQFGDPTGQTRWKPLLSDTIYLAGHSPVWSGSWRSDPIWREKWLQVRQEDYRRAREQGGTLYRKMLGYWSQRYGIDADLMIPADLPREAPLPPETTITETWGCADNSTDISCDLTWTALSSGFGLESNRARHPYSGSTSGTALVRADSDLSGDDHYAQLDVTGWSNGSNVRTGTIVRKDSSATLTYYHGRSSDTTAQLFKFVSGSATQLGSNVTVSETPAFAVKTESDGSTIKCYTSGTERISQTDTAITGNVRTGIRDFHAVTEAVAVDNFEAADLAAGGGGIPAAVAVYHQRHHNRAL